MPQWDFLDFLAGAGRAVIPLPPAMQAEVTDLVEEGGRVAGVRGANAGRAFEVRADLVVGADGRHSVVRERAGLRSTISARRSTCCGCGCRNGRTTRRTPPDGSISAACW